MYIFLVLLLSLCFTSLSSHAEQYYSPALMLAKTYKGKIDLSQYLVSEKLDGVRAYWDGKKLISKQGNEYIAPVWFTKDFPDQALDGELWLGRGLFQSLLSIVSKTHPVDEEWSKVEYAVFDLPDKKLPFTERLKILRQLIPISKKPYLTLIHQYKLKDKHALNDDLNRIIAAGGEGLMLHRKDSLYQAGRNNNILKVKPYQDAEAIVIAHIPGKGKFLGMLGSLFVTTSDGIKFRIGTGFSNKERRSPPSIGSLITYTYHGKTDRGIPNICKLFASKK
ncbi:MAG: DNA ligase [Methylococcaceae bacterium]|nr:DNA ligase [Methylococcaceae bacterium]